MELTAALVRDATRKFSYSFRVRADRSRVREFHSNPDSLALISPPFVPLRFRSRPPMAYAGDRIEFTLYLGPLQVDWTARIEAVSEDGFWDVQEAGPFRLWVHRHEFVPTEDGGCEIRDTIWADPGFGLRKRLVCSMMWRGLPFLFAWRRRATRRLLQSDSG